MNVQTWKSLFDGLKNTQNLPPTEKRRRRLGDRQYFDGGALPAERGPPAFADSPQQRSQDRLFVNIFQVNDAAEVGEDEALVPRQLLPGGRAGQRQRLRSQRAGRLRNQQAGWEEVTGMG